ncbi:MAG: F0F1 ATP synthase subunit epsilon [Armatimonadetes bacterium]|nr:F0F1 ATP synthase subunit epsilon [Armatimonadota bacterium]
MLLRVLVPTRVLVEEEVTKVIAEALNGSFCLLPLHIDFVSALAPGILSYNTRDGQEHFVAVNEGLLVKAGHEVTISTREAIPGDDLESLRALVQQEAAEIQEREASMRAALSKLTTSLVRGLRQLGDAGHG